MYTFKDMKDVGVMFVREALLLCFAVISDM